MSNTLAAPPGHYVLEQDDAPFQLRAMVYDGETLKTHEAVDLAALTSLREEPGVLWLDVVGLNRDVLEALATTFELHPLAIEDAAHPHQRAKLDVYPAHDVIIARMVMASDEATVRSEQVSLLLGDGWLITIQEEPGDPFDAVRHRIRSGKGQIRERGADYLAYALLDALVDHYFPLIESFGDALEEIEDAIVDRSKDADVSRIHQMRRALVTFRRSVWPLREMLLTLSRGGESRFGEDTRVYLRDTQDHVMRVLDMMESYRETVASLMDLHLSMVSQRTNEVMQVLTIVSTIFIPLTFIAGIYGMNFDTAMPLNMPETQSPIGYPVVMGAMAVLAALLLLYFRRRGWLGGRAKAEPDA
ncbi:MAG: magnesium transporter [Myxococcota bacterium]|jgi:magnesium transporter